MDGVTIKPLKDGDSYNYLGQDENIGYVGPHDAIAKYVYEQHRMKLVPGCKVEYPADEFIHSEGNIEYWWNLSVKTAMKTKNNKPDLII